MLRRHVGRLARVADQSGAGRGVHDRPAGREQVRELVLHAEVHAAQHDALHAVPLVLGEVGDVVLRAGDAGVVVRVVEPSELHDRAATILRTDSLDDTSQCTNRAPGPASSTVSSAATRSTSATITDAPARANASADARPMPAPAPVTSATRPEKS